MGVLLQGFEWYLPENQNHWNLLKEQAKELADMGITAIWLPPAYKGASGSADVGYGVYDVYDLGEFDQKGSVATKYGTREEYLAAIEELQKNGIEVYADIVLNHMMGADEIENVEAVPCASNERGRETGQVETIDSWSKFTFPARNGKYSSFTWNYTHFDGIDWDQKKQRNAIFRYKNKDWDLAVDGENQNYDYLMGADIDFSNEEVVKQLEEWGKWYIQTTGVDGLRLDAVKHISAPFYRDWLRKMRSHFGKELFAVGEYWNPKEDVLSAYMQNVEGEMSLFDVPLHFHFYQAATSNGNFSLASIFKGTFVEKNPVKAVTFVDNHDTQPGQALQSYVPAWFRPLAYAMILLREEGYPCVFWGDIYGIPHDTISPMKTMITNFLQVRNRYMNGLRRDYFDSDNVIGWTYEGGVAVVMTDSSGAKKGMSLGEKHAGKTMCSVPIKDNDSVKEVILDANGFAEFEVDGGSVAVYVIKEI